MVAYTYNPSTPEAEVERLPCMSLRSAWTTVGDTTSEMKQKGRRGRELHHIPGILTAGKLGGFPHIQSDYAIVSVSNTNQIDLRV